LSIQRTGSIAYGIVQKNWNKCTGCWILCGEGLDNR
jgi:hypothetical protein